MSYCFRSLLSAGVLLLVLAAPTVAAAQGNPEPHSFKFNSGQGLQPIFEGWAKNPDGSFQMHFGYFNRNFGETLVIPVGPDNKLEPGVADRGQPTVFNTRIRRQEFSVTVPKDWGKKELVWTVTVRGTTEKAVAWLQPEWEIDPIYRGRTLTEAMKKNKAPTVTLEAPPTVTFPNPFILTALVKDDGLPVPRKGPPRTPAVGQETPPALKPLPDQPEIPVNVPAIPSNRGGGGGGGRGQQEGPVVSWVLWRGPAAATFDATTTPVKDGKAVVNVALTKQGTYQFRARVSDGELTTEQDVTVTVR